MSQWICLKCLIITWTLSFLIHIINFNNKSSIVWSSMYFTQDGCISIYIVDNCEWCLEILSSSGNQTKRQLTLSSGNNYIAVFQVHKWPWNYLKETGIALYRYKITQIQQFKEAKLKSQLRILFRSFCT